MSETLQVQMLWICSNRPLWSAAGMFMHPDTLSWTPNVSYFLFDGNGLAARSNVFGVISFAFEHT